MRALISLCHRACLMTDHSNKDALTLPPAPIVVAAQVLSCAGASGWLMADTMFDPGVDPRSRPEILARSALLGRNNLQAKSIIKAAQLAPFLAFELERRLRMPQENESNGLEM